MQTTTDYEIEPAIYHRRWAILAVLCTSLIIVIIGNTALNVAIPTLARELDASTSSLQWMVDAYSLVFAGLLFLLTGPIVILWRREPVRLGWVQSLAVLVSAVSSVLVTSLFTGFLSPFSGGMSLQPGYTEPLVGESISDYDQVRGLGIVVWTIVVLTIGFVIPLCRFRLKPGLMVIGFALLVIPARVLSGTEVMPLVYGFLAAGLVVEVGAGLLSRPVLGRVGASLVAAGYQHQAR